MYITLDILQRRGACQEYIDFFQKRFPDGVEMLEMIEHGHLPYHALHWGYKWLDPNQNEVEAYWKKVRVENSEGVDESDHVTNSRIISFSTQVDNSESVYHSNEIFNSRYVTNSRCVTDGEFIDNSEFVDRSMKILRGKNVTDSSEVVDSIYVANSHGVFDSNNIVDAHYIWHSNSLTNCGFCFNCYGLINSLFCFGQENGEYMLFNKQIDKMRFEMIMKQFKRYVGDGACMTNNWDTLGGAPVKIYDYRKHTQFMTDTFWSWVKTLPGYNPDILYSLTFNPLFLK